MYAAQCTWHLDQLSFASSWLDFLGSVRQGYIFAAVEKVWCVLEL